MSINKELIMKLRSISHAGFADCKKALEENNYDLEESVKWLRSKGISKYKDKNALKDAKEGGTWVKKDKNGVAIIEVNSETDFTATNESFSKLSSEIVDLILKKKPLTIDETNALVMDNGVSVEDSCFHLSSVTGEKISLRRMQYLSILESQSVACYRHNNGKISTFLVFDKPLKDEDIYGFAVHYAANNPKFLSSDEVDQNWMNSEREIIFENLKKENKPEQFWEKIIQDRLQKMISQDTFLEQPYLYDSSKTVKQKLEELGANVVKGVYFGLGG